MGLDTHDGLRLDRGASGGYRRARQRLARQLASDGIRDARVLAAFEAVERHQLVPEGLRDRAYQDTPLPIGDGQTISAPGVVALMSEAAELAGDERVLEVGTGSGYQAAIASRLAAEVVSIERFPRLASRARRALDALAVHNVVVHLGDGTLGRPHDAPYDAILVTAGGPEVPRPLLEQLAPGGRLVGPFGTRDAQQLLRIRRHRQADARTAAAGPEFTREVIARCTFVDLIGAHGWSA